MILDCSEMEVPAAMMHVMGTMLYPNDRDRRRAWITWGLLKMFQRIEVNIEYDDKRDMLNFHKYFGEFVGLLSYDFGGASTFVQNIYDSRDVYSVYTNDERTKMGLRAGKILEVALREKVSISKSTKVIHDSIMSEIQDCDSKQKVHSPRSEEKNTWREFMSVSHLWAAACKCWINSDYYGHVFMVDDFASLFTSPDRFLIDLSDKFDAFLNCADYIKSHAISPRLGMCWRDRPILSRETTWEVIPSGIRANDLMVFFARGMTK